MTIAFRLHEAMSKAGIPSQSELARRSGVPQPTINRILKGVGRQGPAVETLKKLAAACGVPFQWLGDGTGAALSQPYGEDPVLATLPDIGKVPVVQKTRRRNRAAGPVQIKRAALRLSTKTKKFAIHAEEKTGDEVYLGRAWLQRGGYDDQMLIALSMTGDSMAPGLYAGDTLIVNLAETRPHDGEVFVFNYEGTVLVRRLIRDAGAWWLSSDNSDQRRFQRKQYSGVECSVIGRVVYKLSEKV